MGPLKKRMRYRISSPLGKGAADYSVSWLLTEQLPLTPSKSHGVSPAWAAPGPETTGMPVNRFWCGGEGACAGSPAGAQHRESSPELQQMTPGCCFLFVQLFHITIPWHYPEVASPSASYVWLQPGVVPISEGLSLIFLPTTT